MPPADIAAFRYFAFFFLRLTPPLLYAISLTRYAAMLTLMMLTIRFFAIFLLLFHTPGLMMPLMLILPLL